MTDYDIQTDKDRAYRDKDVLERLYWQEGLNQKEIADIFSVNKATIWRWMDKFDMDTRDNTERQVADKRLLDEDWLREKYHGEGMTITEVSELLEVSRMPVFRALKRHGIDRRGKAEHNRKTHPGFLLNQDGYLLAYSHAGSKTQDRVVVHRLIAVAEHGVEAVKDMDVHHKNGIPWDNRADNLELIAHDEHARHHFEKDGGPQPWQQ